jgi:hypothetical protein
MRCQSRTTTALMPWVPTTSTLNEDVSKPTDHRPIAAELGDIVDTLKTAVYFMAIKLEI